MTGPTPPPSSRRAVLKSIAAAATGASLGALARPAEAQDAKAPELLRESAPGAGDGFSEGGISHGAVGVESG